MINLTDQMAKHGDVFDRCLADGADLYGARRSTTLTDAKRSWAAIRKMYGLTGNPPLLTAPDANLKLDKAVRPTYGLTLQHYVTKLANGLTVNACPWAGDCVKVCVLDNGMGRYGTVQLARRARTHLFAQSPCSAGVLLGYELARAVDRDGPILLRPNVNSDVEWENVAPSLTDGKVFGDDVTCYGYSKSPSVLTSDRAGWIGNAYRVAYSWNENSDTTYGGPVQRFMESGGNVAIVTDRKPKGSIEQWCGYAQVVDADLSDEWILDCWGVFGDLSAKGKARKLIGTSGFVYTVYGGA